MSRDRRLARGFVVAVVFAVVMAAPAAAAQPTRTVLQLRDIVRHFPAGVACPFDVTLTAPAYRFTLMELTDGREVSFGHGIRTITNDATGASIDLPIDAHEVDRFDAGVIRGSVDGQSIFTFAPGDAAPDGSTVDHTYSIFIQGKVSYLIADGTFATLAISVQGTYFDICAAIS